MLKLEERVGFRDAVHNRQLDTSDLTICSDCREVFLPRYGTSQLRADAKDLVITIFGHIKEMLVS